MPKSGSLLQSFPKGPFFGNQVESTVDSEVARYYLESYLQGKTNNLSIDAKISALYSLHGESIPSRDELLAISQEFSVDFAALFLADRLLSNECNRKLNHSFDQYLRNSSTVDASPSPYLVLFVPGWDYADNGHLTGADFAAPRKLAIQFGFENRLVELPPTGSVEQNAEFLAAEIRRHTGTGKKILLAGASSAGPAIQLTLSERLNKTELAAVKAWLNLGGILQGSPLIDYLQDSPQRWLFNAFTWFKGWDKAAILSMSTEQSRARFSGLRGNPDILVINYLGIPLSGQLSKYSGDKYPLLRPHGPNDGLTLLTDAIAPNSLTVVALGSDHFFAEDLRINEKTVALMKLMIDYYGPKFGAGLHLGASVGRINGIKRTLKALVGLRHYSIIRRLRYAAAHDKRRPPLVA
ncbi:hypothetical protein [Pseudomonas anguilliseptica]|uniref:Uncharacterized protein n=1 Tax=Pseudomonas anguilliseptica TaxID=53406 RepID=A0A1H4P8A7_PSEAG|nr:hypothetical protein [Pseudomonas anguilliseptica]SEC03589.1 hypothetical protein SAMN05421553_0211 [Pseudomonas anguilliseptica]